MKFIKIHLQIILYIIANLKKKKPYIAHIKFFIDLAKQYYQMIISEYKKVFLYLDKDYRESIKKQKNYAQLKTDLQRALKLLRYLDKQMEKDRKNRQEIRQFWLDFTKNGQLRAEVFNQLAKELK